MYFFYHVNDGNRMVKFILHFTNLTKPDLLVMQPSLAYILKNLCSTTSLGQLWLSIICLYFAKSFYVFYYVLPWSCLKSIQKLIGFCYSFLALPYVLCHYYISFSLFSNLYPSYAPLLFLLFTPSSL